MNSKRLLLLTILPVLLFCFSVQAQERTVTGKVTDSKSGAALQSVTIRAKGTTAATQTNADGSFTLKVANGINSLLISSIGYADKEVRIGNGPVQVLLEPAIVLSDVVVVAYGTRKKEDLTGAVTSIGTKDFQKGNIASAEQLLQGKVAGLQVTTGGGSAGGGSRIRIYPRRGITECF